MSEINFDKEKKLYSHLTTFRKAKLGRRNRETYSFIITRFRSQKSNSRSKHRWGDRSPLQCKTQQRGIQDEAASMGRDSQTVVTARGHNSSCGDHGHILPPKLSHLNRKLKGQLRARHRGWAKLPLHVQPRTYLTLNAYQLNPCIFSLWNFNQGEGSSLQC